ncbi:MAG: hypothetical protein QNL28_04485 [Flavobacteriaceae bacterium]
MRKLIILSALLILACNSEPKLITFEDVYQIELPGDMSSSIELNEDASLEYSNIIKEKYLIIIHESKEDWKNIVGETDYLKKYLNYISENFETTFNSLAQIKNITLNESTVGTLVEIKGKTEGIEIIWNTIVVEGESNIYQISYWTLGDMEYKMEELFAAAKTFREL